MKGLHSTLSSMLQKDSESTKLSLNDSCTWVCTRSGIASSLIWVALKLTCVLTGLSIVLILRSCLADDFAEDRVELQFVCYVEFEVK